MKQETLKALKFNIENFNGKNIYDIHFLFRLARIFDSPEILNEFNNPFLLDNDIETVTEMAAKTKNKEEIIKKYGYNVLKNDLQTHSFNGILKSNISFEGLKIKRPDDKMYKEKLKFYTKQIGYDYLFPYSKSSDSQICTLSFGNHNIVHYSLTSPEWFCEFLLAFANVTHDEYKNRDTKTIFKKLRNTFDSLDNNDFNEIETLTYRLVDKYLNKINPCVAVINNEKSYEKIKLNKLGNLQITANKQEKEKILNQIETRIYGKNSLENNIKKDIPADKITVIEIPYFEKV